MSDTGVLVDHSGCMFSGKTEEMMGKVRRAEVGGRKILVFTPVVALRGAEDVLYSHADRKMKAIPVDYHSEKILEKARELAREVKIFGVALDEAQFFDEDLPEVVSELRRRFELVLTAHLNYTFDGRPFPFRSKRRFEDDSDVTVGKLMELAEQVYSLTAVCTYNDNGKICGSGAYYSQRIVDGKEQTTGDTILIGEQQYEARCSKHIKYPSSHSVGKFTGYLSD